MNRVSFTELRPGVRVRQISTGRTGKIVPVPEGAWVELGGNWVDFGQGPITVRDTDLDLERRRVRLTVRHNSSDPEDDFRVIARLRHELWARSAVEIEPDQPTSQTQRNEHGDAFFEFATQLPHEVERIVRQFLPAKRVMMTDLGEVGLVCVRCGYAAGFVTQCPSCGLRDIAPCPSCRNEVPREQYIPVSGDLFKCPKCTRRVRLKFASIDMTTAQSKGPVVLVHDAQG